MNPVKREDAERGHVEDDEKYFHGSCQDYGAEGAVLRGERLAHSGDPRTRPQPRARVLSCSFQSGTAAERTVS